MLTDLREGVRVREIATGRVGEIDTVYPPYRGCGDPECCGSDGPGSVEVKFDGDECSCGGDVACCGSQWLSSYESFSTGYDGDECDELEAINADQA